MFKNSHLKDKSFSWLVPNITVWVHLREADPKTAQIFKKAEILYLDSSRFIAKVRFLEEKREIMCALSDLNKASSFWTCESYEDLLNMSIYNYPEIMNNLLIRKDNNEMYTNLREILIFFLPDKFYSGGFSPAMINYYMQAFVKNLNLNDCSPHLYRFVCKCLNQTQRSSQSIIISGEVNSGKTLNFTKAAEFISLMNKSFKEELDNPFNMTESKQIDINEEVISSILFLIDLFTSTRTLECENSTKATRSISVYHDRNAKLISMNFDVILLDHSRLKNSNLREESSFLIFYFLLDVLSENLKKEIGLNNFEDYTWIKKGVAPQWNSSKDYKRQFFNSLAFIGFDQTEILTILKMLVSIILLEQFEKENKVFNLEDLTIIKFQNLLEIHLIKENSNINYDEMARILYRKIVRWIINKINEKLNVKEFEDQKKNKLYILEMQSWSNSEKREDSVSEIMINYLHEKTQETFLEKYFKSVEINFLQEGLFNEDTHSYYRNNLKIISLIENRILNIFSIIDQNDIKKNLFAIMAKDQDNIFFINENTDKFVILHYFEEVEYKIGDFKKKNRISYDKILHRSMNTHISDLFKLKNDNSSMNMKEKMIKKGLKLKNILKNSEINFIKCFKIQQQEKPNYERLLNQLEANHIVNLCHLFKEGYAIILDYSEFCDFFQVLNKETEHVMPKSMCENILKLNFQDVYKQKSLFGKQKIFLKQDLYDKLLKIKNKILRKKANRFSKLKQPNPELSLTLGGLKNVIKVIIRLQSKCRAKQESKKILNKQKSAILMMKIHHLRNLRFAFLRYKIHIRKLSRQKQCRKILKIILDRFIKYQNKFAFNKFKQKLNIKKKSGHLLSPPNLSKIHKASKVITPETLLQILEKEKVIEHRKGSLMEFDSILKPKLSLGQKLKYKILGVPPKSSFNSLIFHSETQSSFDQEGVNTQLPEVMEKSLNYEENDSIKRRKCIIARSFQEFENKSSQSILESYLEYDSKNECLPLLSINKNETFQNNEKNEKDLNNRPNLLDKHDFPTSLDSFLDFELLDPIFLNQVKEENYEEFFKKLVLERVIWGIRQKYSKIMAYGVKLIEKPLMDIPKAGEKFAKLIFKYILQYCGDRNTKFDREIQLQKFLKLILDEQTRFFLQDEVYLQLIKQSTNNLSLNSHIEVLKLMSIVGSLITPSANNFMAILNYLYEKVQKEENQKIISLCKYCFVRISKTFEVGARRIGPIPDEIFCIENCLQFMMPVYFLTGEHLLIPCESYTRVRDVKFQIAEKFKMKSALYKSLGLYYIQKGEGIHDEEGFLDDKLKILELLSRWEEKKSLCLKKMGVNIEIKMYLKIRFFHRLTENIDDVTLLFTQCVHEFLNGRYPLEEKEILFLASTKMTVDYGDFSEEKTNFLKLNVGDYIPKDEVEKYDPKTWIDKIFMDYLKMKTYSKTKGKYIFVDFLRKNEEFQCTYFDGKFLFEKKETDQIYIEGLIIVKKDKLVLCKSDKEVKDSEIDTSKIENLSLISKNKISFYLSKDEENSVKILSDNCKEIYFLLKTYKN